MFSMVECHACGVGGWRWGDGEVSVVVDDYLGWRIFPASIRKSIGFNSVLSG